MKILVADSIAEEGLQTLREHAEVDVKLKSKPEDLQAMIGEYDAVIVRSATQITADIIKHGDKLKVIGRAGVGIDNIDVEAATSKGIVVVNAPTGNTVSAAEHAFGLMLALARHIPQANSLLKSGVWQKSKLTGTELRGKTLGIVGLGNVGSEVAKRALAFEMRVIVYDPYVSTNYVRSLNVTLVSSLDQLLEQSDFITLHIPRTATTASMIDAEALSKAKPGLRIINCARGGLIDEEALAKAVEEGKVAGAAFDVFATEPLTESPLFKNDQIIVTPHLGASTIEAQVNVAVDIAKQVLTVLRGEFSQYAVNTPHIPSELSSYLPTGSIIGSLASQLLEGRMDSLHIKYSGEIAEYDCSALKEAVLSGLLQQASEEKVTIVNAKLIASKRGLRITEESDTNCQGYPNLLTLTVNTAAGPTIVSGTLLRDETHVVQVNEFWMDIIPAGNCFLFCDHIDRPGLIGAAGSITGKANININSMHLSRLQKRGPALMILALDEPLPAAQLQELLALPDVHTARVVKL